MVGHVEGRNSSSRQFQAPAVSNVSLFKQWKLQRRNSIILEVVDPNKKIFHLTCHWNEIGAPCFLFTIAIAKYRVPIPIGVCSSGPSQNGASPSPTSLQ